jgi:hypothetical protein
MTDHSANPKQPTSRVPHPFGALADRVGYRAKLDRLSYSRIAILSEAEEPVLSEAEVLSLSKEPEVELAVAFASEIGPGFSPDIHWPRFVAGFSTRDMPSDAFASRYAKPSGLALSGRQRAGGFSPWGMLSEARP